jgi:hypothetical protein
MTSPSDDYDFQSMTLREVIITQCHPSKKVITKCHRAKLALLLNEAQLLQPFPVIEFHQVDSARPVRNIEFNAAS